MSTLGNFLKNEREKKGLSLHEIGLSLKINPKVLSALEEGQKGSLPAKTFLRGFVKSYAQYLRLDVDEALRLFNEEYGTKPEESRPATTTPAAEAPPVAIIKPRQGEEPAGPKQNRIILIAGGIILFIVVVFVAKMVEKYQKERATRPLVLETTPAPQPPPGETSEAMVTTEPVLTEGAPATTSEQGATSGMTLTPTATPSSVTPPLKSTTTVQAPVTSTPVPTATPFVTPAPTATPKPTLPPTPTPTPTPTPKPTVTPSPTTTPKPSPTASPSPAATPQASPTATPMDAATRPNEVIIEAMSNVTLKYTLSDGKTQSLTLEADKLHTIRARGTITLDISDGGAVNLIVNGRDRGAPGVAGQPIKVNLPK